ncbi:MAG: hypothetical protein WC663_04300 [Patescibacteria group bacterium]|jgi:hypothetical protein
MTKEKWDLILENVEKKFEVSDKGIDEGYGEKMEWIEFENPQGKMRLEWVEKQKKSGFKNVNVDDADSESEMINYVKAYIFSEEKNGWEEMKATDLTQI